MRIGEALQVTSLSFSPDNRVQRGSDGQPFAQPLGRHPFGALNRPCVKAESTDESRGWENHSKANSNMSTKKIKKTI